MGLNLKEHIKDIEKKSYIKEDLEVDTMDDIIDCSHGINPFGFSKRIRWEEELSESFINSYPQYPYSVLKKRICSYWKKHASINDHNVIIGHGSISILDKISGLIIDKGATVLGYCPQFTDYMNCVAIHNGKYEYVPLRKESKLKFDLEEFKSKISTKYKVLYIDNPNNPTGQVIEISKINEIVKAAKKNDIWVIVDEAYGDFMKKENSAIKLVEDNENLIVVRTFSKGFGLAGLRIGYAICSRQFSQFYKKVSMPFDINSFGHYAAVTALSDESFLKDSISNIKKSKSVIMDSLSKISVMQTDMGVPIMTLEYPDSSVDFKKLLIKNGVLAEAGSDFVNLGKNYVRLRIPKEPYELARILGDIENKI
ncbi:histidinol-phosphate aminotransferase [Peptoclostridium litorale DSM 5388]|uniref:Histidinol-phosphate aminotransferase HisC n=1 Tax=Peptoclostridium litorale DSM 5388 TaxID=1121324 RepID=A0A069RI48_PEPLI|nr:histidinol-phosphate transaminase [Peptoclostridium litorale]KDR96704.1 histidinol-phosphate aminotransferase HisC [Peptoclostridium litorale DSM 5388]SIN67571.1 histidinol-phosphate aminotransferase [Peptoclostridium litorale DSM 5388]